MRNKKRMAAVAALFIAGCAEPALLSRAHAGDPQDFTELERGRYLSVLSDCQSCHTRQGGQAFAGGRAIETPFGNILAPNITPDAATGIGAWTDEQFDDAVRRGIGRKGEHLYPAMPFTAYTKMSRDDVLAIRAYLDSLSPVSNQVVANQLPFPFSVRASMRFWRALYFTEGEYVPDPKKSAELNRGGFLVDGPSHCGACHTPKTFLGGDKVSQYLEGGSIQDWYAPDITNDEVRGLGKWSPDDLVTYLRSGHNRITAATGPMAETITFSTSKMDEGDLRAIAAYLKSLPGSPSNSKSVAMDDPAMVAGASIYRDQCSACHGIEGKGIPNLFPDLVASSVARSDDAGSAIRIILRGARSVATTTEPTAPGMPSYGRLLHDDEVAAVLTYVRNAWGSPAPAVAPSDVAKVRSALASRSD
jgi:mono/diheme cytochrome c family protein